MPQFRLNLLPASLGRRDPFSWELVFHCRERAHSVEVFYLTVHQKRCGNVCISTFFECYLKVAVFITHIIELSEISF